MEMVNRSIIAVVLGVLVLGFHGVCMAAYYAGYYYEGYEWSAPWGGKGDIYTIDPTVPANHYMCQWIMLILDYDPPYWISIGYDKSVYDEPRYFKEAYWSNGSWGGIYEDGPDEGTWHDYSIVHAQEIDMKKWRLYIDCGDRGYFLVYPYEPKDWQAFVETDTSSIEIDSSHFEHLRYYTGRSWANWTDHLEGEDYPYEVQEVDDTEFTACGGG